LQRLEKARGLDKEVKHDSTLLTWYPVSEKPEMRSGSHAVEILLKLSETLGGYMAVDYTWDHRLRTDRDNESEIALNWDESDIKKWTYLPPGNITGIPPIVTSIG